MRFFDIRRLDSIHRRSSRRNRTGRSVWKTASSDSREICFIRKSYSAKFAEQLWNFKGDYREDLAKERDRFTGWCTCLLRRLPTSPTFPKNSLARNDLVGPVFRGVWTRREIEFSISSGQRSDITISASIVSLGGWPGSFDEFQAASPQISRLRRSDCHVACGY